MTTCATRKFNPVIVNPTLRNETFLNVSRILGLTEPDQLFLLRMSMTPPQLRHLRDHGVRGQKSLGRIQQINNRRRFKARPALSR